MMLAVAQAAGMNRGELNRREQRNERSQPDSCKCKMSCNTPHEYAMVSGLQAEL